MQEVPIFSFNEARGKNNDLNYKLVRASKFECYEVTNSSSCTTYVGHARLRSRKYGV